MESLAAFSCPNPACPLTGVHGGANLTIHARYGPARQRRLIRCLECGKTFSERRFGPDYYLHQLPPEKCRKLLIALWNNASQEQASEEAGVNRRTVARYARRIGDTPGRDERLKTLARSCLGAAYDPNLFVRRTWLENFLQVNSLESRERQYRAILKDLNVQYT